MFGNGIGVGIGSTENVKLITMVLDQNGLNYINVNENFGSQDWTRTSSLLVNSQTHYHCATWEYQITL